MDWRDEEISPDFSVVLHGLGGGPVHILKSDRKESAQLPDITLSGSSDDTTPDQDEGASNNSSNTTEDAKDDSGDETGDGGTPDVPDEHPDDEKYSDKIDPEFNDWVLAYTPPNNI